MNQIVPKHAAIKISSIIFSILLSLTCKSQQSTFLFPGGGEKNNNSTIGDFCCTGETATVLNNMGSVVGYVYYYGFKGGKNIGNNQSIATDFYVLVSGVSDYNNAQQDREKGKINFSAAELYNGSTKTVRAGELIFSATISRVQKYTDALYYIMGSIGIKIVVTVPVILTLPPAVSNQVPDNLPLQGSEGEQSKTGTGMEKRILENGDVEISYADGSKKIIFESGTGYKIISPAGQESVVSFMSVPTYIPPNMPDENIDRWLSAVNKSLLSFIKDQLRHDHVSVTNLLAGEGNLNIYEIINRRFRFIQSLNSK